MRDINDLTVLVLPGLGGSGPDHWQAAWVKAFPGMRWVEQANFEKPAYPEWSARLTEAVAQAERPVVLVAHSLGTSLTMRWAFEQPEHARKVAGAFLVAPTDRDRFDASPTSPVRGWGPMILKPLPFPSMVLASLDDDRVSFERAQEFSKAWGSTLIAAGKLGHMGSAAKLGVWPFGLFYFGQFIGSLPSLSAKGQTMKKPYRWSDHGPFVPRFFCSHFRVRLNAGDGDIGAYTLQADGSLKPGQRYTAGKLAGPMTVSPDKRFLVAGVRSKPFTAHTYAIDRTAGTLTAVGTGPLAESFPYIFHDRSGRFLLCASYGGNLVAVSPVGADGRVGEPLQVIPTARNAHSIITDRTGRFVFVPHLGTDQVFQFLFDQKSGRLTANTPPLVQLKAGTGPRANIITSPDNRYVYLLNELTATVTTLALDAKTGLLTEVASVNALPADSKLVPGGPRGPDAPKRDRSNDIWASDLHLTPNGRFLYAAERTSNSIAAFSVDAATGKLTYLGSTPTERQPRGFRIDPAGRFVVVSGELSDTLSTYAIDPSSGALKAIGKYPTGRKGSNWVEIVSFD